MKRLKLLPKLLGFLALAFVGNILVAPFVMYYFQQPRQREIQTNLLEKKFSRIQQANNTTLFVPKRKPPFNRLTFKGAPFPARVTLAVGDQFEASDRHWSATYTIKSIEADGVNIHYAASGDAPALMRPSSGTIKLEWR